MKRVPIVITHQPKIKHNGDLFRDGWICCMMCGKSGCGKTSLAAQFIPYISDVIKYVCIATKVFHNPFHIAIQDWCKKTDRVCVINSNPDKIRAFVDGLYMHKLLVPGEKELLLIFDDFSIHNHSRALEETLVIEAFTRWRNLGVNMLVICQDATMVAPSCRNCTNMRILFNSASKTAIHTFCKDFVDRIPDPLILQNLLRYIGSVPFSYILVKENPIEVSVGAGMKTKKIMDAASVMVPTYQEIMKEIGVTSKSELEKAAADMQKEIGNTAPELTPESQGRSSPHPGFEESDNDDDDSGPPDDT